MASAMTGENAARLKVRSISSQVCCSAAWMTDSVMASSWLMAGPDVDDEVAVGIGTRPIAGFEHRRGIHLFEDGRPGNDGRRAAVSRGHRPACRASFRRTRRSAISRSAPSSVSARPSGIDQPRQVDGRPDPDDRSVEVDQIGADLRQLDLEAGEIGLLEQALQHLARGTSAEGSGTLRICVWPTNCMSAEWE